MSGFSRQISSYASRYRCFKVRIKKKKEKKRIVDPKIFFFFLRRTGGIFVSSAKMETFFFFVNCRPRRRISMNERLCRCHISCLRAWSPPDTPSHLFRLRLRLRLLDLPINSRLKFFFLVSFNDDYFSSFPSPPYLPPFPIPRKWFFLPFIRFFNY